VFTYDGAAAQPDGGRYSYAVVARSSMQLRGVRTPERMVIGQAAPQITFGPLSSD
jgi:hypothetical protein